MKYGFRPSFFFRVFFFFNVFFHSCLFFHVFCIFYYGSVCFEHLGHFEHHYWLLCFPFWQSYFIKLFDAGLQCEFIRTFYLFKKKLSDKTKERTDTVCTFIKLCQNCRKCNITLITTYFLQFIQLPKWAWTR